MTDETGGSSTTVAKDGRVFTSRAAGSPTPSRQAGPLIFIGLCGLAAYASQSPLPLFPAVFAFSMLSRQRRRAASAQLERVRMDVEGLTIEGLGRLPWSSISDAKVARGAWRGLPRAFLSLRISPDIENMVERSPASVSGERPEARFWRVENAQTLVLQISGLEDDVEDVQAAFEYFWGRGVAVTDL